MVVIMCLAIDSHHQKMCLLALMRIRKMIVSVRMDHPVVHRDFSTSPSVNTVNFLILKTIFFYYSKKIIISDSPILLSFPHFYLANDSYRTAFEGITPADPEKHRMYLDVQPVIKNFPIKLNLKKKPTYNV